MNASLSLTKYHYYPSLAILISVHYAVSVRILTSELSVQLHICRSLQTWLLQLTILQSTKFSDKATSKNPKLSCWRCYQIRRFSHIAPVLKSLHWLKVKERIEYKLLSLSYKVPTTSQPTYFLKNWFLFSLLAVLDPRLLSPYPDHLLPHHSILLTVVFYMQHPTFGINSLILTVSVIYIWSFTFSPYIRRIHTVITTTFSFSL